MRKITKVKCVSHVGAGILCLCVGLVLSVAFSARMQAQTPHEGPKIAVKTNAVYWATSTPNLAFEFGLKPKLTLDVLGGYNPFTFKDNEKMKHWLVQSELRYWLCERFNGHFVGVHLHGGMFNVGGLNVPFGLFSDLEKYRYEGEFYGGGISYGYQWVLGKRWNLEAEIGIGYTRLNYDKYECPKCGEWLGKDSYDFFGVTKAALSIIYILK